MNKKEVESIISELSYTDHPTMGKIRVKYADHTINIGDFLAKHRYKIRNMLGFIDLWEECGTNKSLQQIVSDSGWEKIDCGDCRVCIGATDDGDIQPKCRYPVERLKSPESRALFKFLDKTK